MGKGRKDKFSEVNALRKSGCGDETLLFSLGGFFLFLNLCLLLQNSLLI